MHVEPPWTWSDDASADRVWREVCDQGLSWFRAPDAVAAVSGDDPAGVATRLLGRPPFQLRRRRLETLPGPRKGYENTQIKALFHVDQDPYLPPHLQVLMCVTPAKVGGDSLFLDGWELVREIQRTDPTLYRALFEVSRMIPFSSSRWFGATVSQRLGSVVLSHGAVPPIVNDHVGVQMLAAVNKATPTALKMTAGDVIVANNHRLLHGRTAFTDRNRLLVRLMIWLEDPLPADPELARETALVAARITDQVRAAEAPIWIEERLGVFPDGWRSPAFQHDFTQFPTTPDATSPQRLEELIAMWRRLKLA